MVLHGDTWGERMVTIYILALEEDKYYVGKWKPADVAKRIQQHFDGKGAKWTKKYRPYRVCRIIHDRDDRDETKVTIEMMKIHGIPNVRGGSLSRVYLTKKDWLFAKWKCGWSDEKPLTFDRFVKPERSTTKKRRGRSYSRPSRSRRKERRRENRAKYGQCQGETRIAGGRRCRMACEIGHTTCRMHKYQRSNID
jgi:predicted GIY-YIG superfamily endonuclease